MKNATSTETAKVMLPVVILKKGTVTIQDIKRLRAIGLCVVESSEPSSVRYMEPFPQGYTVQELAALELARTLLTEGRVGTCNHKQALGSMYADILMRGDPLKRVEKVST